MRCLGAHEPEPGVQLVDVAVAVDTRVGLRARACRRTGRCRLVAGPGVDFHVLIMAAEKYGRTRKSTPRKRPAAAAARSLTADAAGPRTAATGSAVDCSTGIGGTGAICPGGRRAIPYQHPRVRGDAAADAGRSGAAEVPRVAGEVSDAARRWRPRRKRTSRRPGGPLATTSVRGGCMRSRANRSIATAASCQATRRRCGRSRASASTPRAPS